MKTKLFLTFTAVLFAAITIFNLNLAQQKAAGDITYAGVDMVAGADGEQGGDGGFDNGKKTHITTMGNYCCCPSVQSFCNDMHFNCTSTFCDNNP